MSRLIICETLGGRSEFEINAKIRSSNNTELKCQMIWRWLICAKALASRQLDGGLAFSARP